MHHLYTHILTHPHTHPHTHIHHRIKMHEQRQTKNKREDVVPKGAVPAYLLDRCATTTVIILFIASRLLRDSFV